MSITLLPPVDQESGDNKTPAKRRPRVLAWIGFAILGALALFLVVLMLAVGAVLVGRSTGTDTTGEVRSRSQETVSTPADELVSVADAPAETSVETPANGSHATNAEVAELLLGFAEAWRNADWTLMGTFASDQVVETAREWHEQGGAPNINVDNMEFILQTCSAAGPDSTACMFSYAPPDGFGLIFDVVYLDGETGPTLTQLTFEGDAG